MYKIPYAYDVTDVAARMSWTTAGADNVASGIKIHDCIWGHGWDPDESENLSVSGFEGLGSTNFDVVNTYATEDFSFSSDEIPGFPSFVYEGTTEDLWADPYAGMDFSIKDGTFEGRGDSGDLRWRIGL